VSILLVDIGNSRIKWGIGKDGRVAQTRAVFHDAERASGFKTVLDSLPDDIHRIFGCNVAGEKIAENFARCIEPRFAAGCEWISSTERCGGLENGYDQPELLGADRWAALYACFAIDETPALVVDAGTACTIDALLANGRHGGGLILPGIYLMERALRGDTSDIGTHSAKGRAGAGNSELFGASTEQAVRDGCLTALVGAVERAYGILQRIETGARLVITGGDAPRIIARLGVAFEHRPALVLEGLALMAKEESER